MELPYPFEEQMKLLLKTEYEEFRSSLETEPQVSIRLNPKKYKYATDLQSVPWAVSDAYYLPSRPKFTLDPLFHAGTYYVQEASSMFLGYIYSLLMKNESPWVLDLCAAPGGKSTHLASMMGGDGWLVSNEITKSRVNILAENMQKWGAPNVMVTSNTPDELGELTSFFDMIVVDAPCSGEGMFRKDEKAIEEWSPENVLFCAERQRQILKDIYPALKEDGILVYSTCTYNQEEDEKIVSWLINELGAELLSVPINKVWGIRATDFGYHFYPHKTKGEGFFLAVLKKCSSDSHHLNQRKPKAKMTIDKNWAKVLPNYVTEPVEVVLYGSTYYALLKDFADKVTFLSSKLRTLYAGIPLGSCKGKDFIPDSALAFSWLLNQSEFSVVELDWKEAIAFLRRENLVLTDVPKGIVLVTFNDVPLGWVKNLGNRCNNLYPQEWRIRMEGDISEYSQIVI